MPIIFKPLEDPGSLDVLKETVQQTLSRWTSFGVFGQDGCWNGLNYTEQGDSRVVSSRDLLEFLKNGE